MSDFISSIKINFVDGITAGARKAKESISGITESVQKIGNGSQSLSVATNLALVTGQLDRFSSGISAAVAVPGTLAASVESSMSRVSTVLDETNTIGGDVPGTLAAIKKKAQEMAGGIGPATLGMEEFNNSTFSLISSGLKAEQAIAGVTQATLLAQATGDSAAVAVSTLGGVYNNFGNKLSDSAAEMGKLSDIIARTHQYFAFENLEQFSTGLSNAAGAAIGFKVPFEQSAAVIGQLNSNMIVGANAGTAMKSILSQMGNASKRLGFEIAKTADGGVDLVATLQKIAAAGLSGAALTKAFGTEAGPAVGILTENLQALQGGYEAVSDSAGTTLAGAEKMTDNLLARQERLTNATQVFNERIGSGANFIAKAGVSAKLAGMRFLNWASSLPVVGEGLAGVSGALMAVGGAAVRGASGFLNFAGGIASSLVMLEKAGPIFGVLKKSVGVFGRGIRSAAVGVFNMGKAAIFAIPKLLTMAAAHWTLLGPILVILAGVAALAVGAVLMVKHWEKIKTFFVNLWEGIKNIFKTAIDWVISNLDNKFVQAALVVIAPIVGIPLAIIKNWDAIKNFFVNLWEGIKNIFTAGIDWIRNKLANIPLIGGLFGDKKGGLFGGRQGAAAVNTLAAGMNDALPAAEQAGLSVAKTVDQYMPHSNAKKGPLSRLTESGASMIETIRQGALRRRLDLSGPLGLRNDIQGAVSGGDTIINIENLTMQAEDAEDIFRFVRMLKVAGGVA